MGQVKTEELHRGAIRDTVRHMAESKKLFLEDPAPILDEEDEETLAAIEEGIRDADEGRTVPIQEVRKQMREWITASSSPKER